MAEHHDVVVVGGGPVGCVAAIAFARRQARVLVLEATPRAHRRLAGEWIHPAGVRVLTALGLDLSTVPHSAGTGFVVFADDGGAPIRLPYAPLSTAAACDHSQLVEALRQELTRYPTISVRQDAMVTEVRAHDVTYLDRCTGAERHIQTGLVVGADGRTSVLHRTLNLNSSGTPLSRTLGVLLHDIELPYEGFGHVMLGGPGPVLIYRLDERRTRVCIDIPVSEPRRPGGADAMLSAYWQVLPEPLREPLRCAIALGRTQWAANGYRGRRHFGQSGLALVGDAVGYYHPMTASGLTLGFLDAMTLASSDDIEQYRRLRSRHTRVPEMLAASLYDIFSGDDSSNGLLRAAVYDMWRRSPRECLRTMRLIGVDSTSRIGFDASFVHCLGIAVRHIVGDLARMEPALPSGAFRRLTGWLRWLADNSLLDHPTPVPARRTAA